MVVCALPVAPPMMPTARVRAIASRPFRFIGPSIRHHTPVDESSNPQSRIPSTITVSSVKSHHYSQHAAALGTELGRALPRELLVALHEKDAARHLLVAARQFAILGLCTWGLIAIANPLVWIPLALAQGFTVFNFTVLLHEVVHHTIFDGSRPAAERALGWLYAVPSGISASQFTRWHLDHHAELGSDEDDPKRHHLSPKINARWVKLLYCSPALFPIYFRAALRASGTYPDALQQRIAFERKVSIAAHLTVLALIWALAGGAA